MNTQTKAGAQPGQGPRLALILGGVMATRAPKTQEVSEASQPKTGGRARFGVQIVGRVGTAEIRKAMRRAAEDHGLTFEEWIGYACLRAFERKDYPKEK